MRPGDKNSGTMHDIVDEYVPSGHRTFEVRTPGSPAPATRLRAPLYAGWACLRLMKSACERRHTGIQDSLERCDLGVKTAAFAALGEMAALREEGVTDPFVLACRGVKEGESTLNRFLAFSFWFNLEWSWMYGQAGQSHHSVQQVRRPALTVLVPTVSVDGDVAAEGVLRFCVGQSDLTCSIQVWLRHTASLRARRDDSPSRITRRS